MFMYEPHSEPEYVDMLTAVIGDGPFDEMLAFTLIFSSDHTLFPTSVPLVALFPMAVRLIGALSFFMSIGAVVPST